MMILIVSKKGIPNFNLRVEKKALVLKRYYNVLYFNFIYLSYPIINLSSNAVLYKSKYCSEQGNAIVQIIRLFQPSLRYNDILYISFH